jgi:hypothetical protein
MPPARKNTPKGSLAGAASDRVRAIIEAAEASADEIRAEAEAEAQRIQLEARESASTLRAEVRSDVQGLLGSIRDAVERLGSDLKALEQRLSEGEGVAGPSPTPAVPEPAAAPQAPAPAKVTAEVEEDPDIALAEDAAVAPDQAPESDLEAARLVALNMALSGASRGEVESHLRDEHGLRDPAPLLDEVYALVGGA